LIIDIIVIFNGIALRLRNSKLNAKEKEAIGPFMIYFIFNPSIFSLPKNSCTLRIHHEPIFHVYYFA